MGRLAVAVACFLAACASAAPRHVASPREVEPPSAPPARTIRIATWNIRDFGPRKATDPVRLAAIAAIVRGFDVVAVQEISDATNRVPALFAAAINQLEGPRWSYVASERTGRTPHSAESYAFYFDADAIECVDRGALYPDPDDRFERDPFAARFVVAGTDSSFVLVTVHTAPGAAVEEIAALDDVFAWVRARWPDEEDVLALGDFNADCDYAASERLESLAIRDARYRWIVPDDADTNTAQSRCAYDRIVVTTPIDDVDWGVEDRSFDPQAIDLSDHWPVWTAISVPQSRPIDRP